MAEERTMALSIYRAMFKFMLSEGITRLIHNDSPDHACVLIEELLHFAKGSILIFCRNLGSDVWGAPSILSALEDALNRKNMNVRVVLQKPPENGVANHALTLLRAHGVDVLQTRNTSVTANFIVVDGKAYRLEKDGRGYACANDADGAAKLAAAFNDLANDSDPVGAQGVNSTAQEQ